MRILYILENKQQAVKIFLRRIADLANSDPALKSVIPELRTWDKKTKTDLGYRSTLSQKEFFTRQWWPTPLMPTLGRQSQVDLYKTSLFYRANSMTVSKATEKPCLGKKILFFRYRFNYVFPKQSTNSRPAIILTSN